MPGAASGAHIDRIFIAMPSWALFGLVVRSEVVEDPMALGTKGINDRAPVEMLVEARAMQMPGDRAIPFKSLAVVFVQPVVGGGPHLSVCRCCAKRGSDIAGLATGGEGGRAVRLSASVKSGAATREHRTRARAPRRSSWQTQVQFLPCKEAPAWSRSGS